MRLLYTTLFFLLLPGVLLRLYWRGIKAPEYRKRWLERLAVFDKSFPHDVIWFHAVSVGEAEALFPLLKLMQTHHPEANFLVTTTTPTGSSRVQSAMGDTVLHVYLPYDLPFVINRFLRQFQPKMAVMMEKEIWPNLFEQCGAQQIPLYIINARLSAGSAKAYKKIGPLITPALENVTGIAAQTEEDRQRFIEIGAATEKVQTMGNIKFDLEISEQVIDAGRLLKRQLFPGRFVWIIASTHKGEEELFVELYRELKTEIPELLLMIVPRHPERFQTVRHLAEEKQLQVVMRSGDAYCTSGTDVYVADTMGELKQLYSAADIAFVGGSMVPIGGHNILEPLGVGVPVMFGPNMINFKDIATNVLAAQAAVQCHDRGDIVESVKRLYDDAQFRDSLRENGIEFIGRNQGATEKVCQLLENAL